MADVPVFLLTEKDKRTPIRRTFIDETKADIIATIDFLTKRGMWSKYHQKHWTAYCNQCENPEMLHLWWDSIVGGAMYEVESPLEESLEEPTIEIEKPMLSGYQPGMGLGRM